MKVHLKQIPVGGLHLEGEEECPIREIEAEEIRWTGPLRYNIDVGVSDGALWAKGALAQLVELRCVACLEKFAYEIRVPAFATHLELRGPETVDLTPSLREDILLNLPAYPHCDREGGRICRAAKVVDPDRAKQQRAAKRKHDWGELDKLKLKR